MKSTVPPGFALCRGFTLVEVVLALGIITFALVGVMALMQSGLKNYREAMNVTIAGSIGQQDVAQCLLADYTSLAIKLPTTNFFDERGLPLMATQSGSAIYQSVTSLLPEAVPGVDARNLAKVRIEVSSPTQPNFHKIFIALIGRQDKGGGG